MEISSTQDEREEYSRSTSSDRYPFAMVDRIRFVKRAQELGFSLDEIAGLLRLHDGSDRASIRKIANVRLTQIGAKLADLQRMESVLKHLITACEHTKANLPCPIIETPPKPSSPSSTSQARKAGPAAPTSAGKTERTEVSGEEWTYVFMAAGLSR